MNLKPNSVPDCSLYVGKISASGSIGQHPKSQTKNNEILKLVFVKIINYFQDKLSGKKQVKIKHTEEFKNQVIEVYRRGIYSTAKECADNYGVNPKTFSRWLIDSCKPATSENQEVKNLQKENARLKMENEILVRHEVAC